MGILEGRGAGGGGEADGVGAYKQCSRYSNHKLQYSVV